MGSDRSDGCVPASLGCCLCQDGRPCDQSISRLRQQLRALGSQLWEACHASEGRCGIPDTGGVLPESSAQRIGDLAEIAFIWTVRCTGAL